jgi:HK97 family phage prohead protease
MIQTLHLTNSECEFKFSEGKGPARFEGYASVFNGNDKMGDTVLPGAYKSCIEKKGTGGIFMRFEHLRHETPGKWVELAEDSKGLHVVGELTPGHSTAENVRASFKHGTVGGLSIGWRPYNSVIERKANGRILKEIDVFEISITADPADEGAEVSSFKSALAEVSDIRDAEHFLRESGGFSRSMATAFVSHFKSLYQSESEDALREEINELKSRLTGQQSAARLANFIKGL